MATRAATVIDPVRSIPEELRPEGDGMSEHKQRDERVQLKGKAKAKG